LHSGPGRQKIGSFFLGYLHFSICPFPWSFLPPSLPRLRPRERALLSEWRVPCPFPPCLPPECIFKLWWGKCRPCAARLFCYSPLDFNVRTVFFPSFFLFFGFWFLFLSWSVPRFPHSVSNACVFSTAWLKSFRPFSSIECLFPPFLRVQLSDNLLLSPFFFLMTGQNDLAET